MKEKRKKAQEQEGSKPEQEPAESRVHLPILLETAQALSRLVVILAGAGTAVSSFAAGCDLLTITIRAGLAVLAAGLLVWSANWFLAQRSLAVVHAQFVASGHQAGLSSTIEREA
jgi:hypothetical protein